MSTPLERRIAEELAKPIVKTRAATILENATKALEHLPPANASTTAMQPIREIRGKRRYRQEESKMQTAFIDWTLEPVILKLYPELFDVYAIPNGTNSSHIAAAKAKREGLKPGVLDVHLPHARGEFIGWWCEFKYGENNLTKNQRLRAERLHQAGHAVTAHGTLEAAQTSVIAYLEHGERLGLPEFLKGETKC
jgi:hypothetical protein